MRPNRKAPHHEPMTLGNMRANGVRALAVRCWACHRTTVLAVDDYGQDVAVPAFGPRMVCSGCGAIGADARPNWAERAAVSELGGRRPA
jgi:hypothetical protein